MFSRLKDSLDLIAMALGTVVMFGIVAVAVVAALAS